MVSIACVVVGLLYTMSEYIEGRERRKREKGGKGEGEGEGEGDTFVYLVHNCDAVM